MTIKPIAVAVTLLVVATTQSAIAQTDSDTMNTGMSMSSTHDSPTAEISRAMSAGPTYVVRNATIAKMDKTGHLTIIRQGSNGFTCMPGNPDKVGMPAMCVDGPSLQWFTDFAEHKPKPTNKVPGITYMLAGATQRSDSNPYDKTDPPITVPGHWMIMWPFDPKTTGLPTTHRDTGAYIMWAGTPYAHMHVMGRP